MFGGKGGVGKSTCAVATALHTASQGQRTLVISTDPTPSLADIFDIKHEPKPVEVRENLYLAELGMDVVKDMWDKKFGLEVYDIFSQMVDLPYPEFVDFITSILPGLKDEFMVHYIKELTEDGEYDRVVWDAAPLGQTMGLLNTPSMVREHLKMAPKVYSKLKSGKHTKLSILSIIDRWAKMSNEDIDFLKQSVDFIMVTIPEALALRQLDHVFAEFERQGFRLSRLVINNVVKTADSDFLRTKQEQQQEYLPVLHHQYGHMQVIELPLFPHEIRRLQDLESIASLLHPQLSPLS
jgi:arsenite-transporting ATPase